MTPTYDEEFLRLVRVHLEPVLVDAGFVFNEVTVGSGTASAPLVRDSGRGRLSRLYYDASTGSVDFELQGEDVDLRDAARLVNDASRSLEERVAALSEAVKRFLVEAGAPH